ncbi:MAG: alpha/beta fold hydrolase [Deltaproteobacteria bacterium]|nr:alpha/beta fold hydrolase [Deltaproteobacteria bacterium]
MSPVTLAMILGVLLVIAVATFVFGIKILIGTIAFFAALYYVGVRCFRDDRQPDEIHFVPTSDGWNITLWRIRPRATPAKPVPVLLQHGLGANHRNLDVDDHTSVAHYLARQGYDCFLPALRGNGSSRMSDRKSPKRHEIYFEDFVDVDLPTVMEKIRELTGSEQVHFVGHSMGAMIGYALAQGDLKGRLRSFTAIAGPCFFEGMSRFKSALPFVPVLRFLHAIPARFIMTVQAPIVRLWPRAAGREEVNPDNMDPKTLAIAAASVLEDLPTTLLLQYARWVREGEFASTRTDRRWEKDLHKITVPLYCMGGPVDAYCPREANDKVVDFVSSEKKKYRMFSKANGDLADYGHGDIVVGRTAPEEVFPTILEWIADND